MISMQNSALTVVTTFSNKPLVLSSKSSYSSASLRAGQSGRRSSFSSSSFRIVRAAGGANGGGGDEKEDENLVELYAGIAGLLSCAVVSYSLFTLKQTGCGLPAGPGGLVGAIEGVSYLGVAGLLGASAYKKSTTGSGLPAGPFALLGAAEGVAFLLLVFGLYVGVAQVLEYGYIPNAVPVEGGKCA